MILGDGLSPSTRFGLAFTLLTLTAWMTSTVSLLVCDVAALPGWFVIGAILIRTHLQTGLFIAGHDSMHGVLWPECRSCNRLLGSLLLIFYAGLPFEVCLRNHRLHHQQTATDRDPDFQVNPRAGLLQWYFRFMAGYLRPRQMASLLFFWAVLWVFACLLGTSGWINVLLFCSLPLLLSSFQLFLFGTYFPHRCQRPPLCKNQPDSLDLPAWLSLIACFHFGYHREHHDQPTLPWFALPACRSQRRSLASAGTPG